MRKTWLDRTFVLRITLAVILVMHSVPTIADGTVNDFGSQFLNAKGFAPIGVPLAWAIKLAHLVTAVLLVLNIFIVWSSIINLLIFLGGIIMVHLQHGWFVVGRGTNGVEFNVLLIGVLVYLILLEGRKQVTK